MHKENYTRYICIWMACIVGDACKYSVHNVSVYSKNQRRYVENKLFQKTFDFKIIFTTIACTLWLWFKCANGVDALLKSHTIIKCDEYMSMSETIECADWLTEKNQMQLDKNNVSWSQRADFFQALCANTVFPFLWSDVRWLRIYECIYWMARQWKQCLKSFRINLRLFRLSTQCNRSQTMLLHRKHSLAGQHKSNVQCLNQEVCSSQMNVVFPFFFVVIKFFLFFFLL